MTKKVSKKETVAESGNLPAYVKELQEKGVVVLQGRTRDELNEMIAAIPEDIQYYIGNANHFYDTGLFSVQVNKK